MSLQLLGLRKGLTAPLARYSQNNGGGVTGTFSADLLRRWQSTKDAGDVIGIDLGTTNSCVAVMVRYNIYIFVAVREFN